MKKDPGCPGSFFTAPEGFFSLFQRYGDRGDGYACYGTDGYDGNDHFLHEWFLLPTLQCTRILSVTDSIADRSRQESRDIFSFLPRMPLMNKELAAQYHADQIA